MGQISKAVACLCIFSIMLVGCYSSTMIDPGGGEKEKMHSGRIKSVILMDGTRYAFDGVPTVVNDTIFGEVTPIESEPAEVSIPLSELAQTGQSPSGNIEWVVTKEGTEYRFEKSPAIVNGAIVGKPKNPESVPSKITVPLAQVREACVSEFLPVETAVSVGLCVTMVVAAIISIPNSSYMW